MKSPFNTDLFHRTSLFTTTINYLNMTWLVTNTDGSSVNSRTCQCKIRKVIRSVLYEKSIKTHTARDHYKRIYFHQINEKHRIRKIRLASSTSDKTTLLCFVSRDSPSSRELQKLFRVKKRAAETKPTTLNRRSYFEITKQIQEISDH